jgi:hypothetical protein
MPMTSGSLKSTSIYKAGDLLALVDERFDAYSAKYLLMIVLSIDDFSCDLWSPIMNRRVKFMTSTVNHFYKVIVTND